jgi:OFA family oxalate/formate antiporter-like MFS transporter
MENISKIHGLALSAWAIAGLTGNNTSEIILKNTDNNYNVVISVATILYSIALLICVNLVRTKEVKN